MNGLQRWAIKTSARNMRDEVGGQVRRVLRGQLIGTEEQPA